MSPPKAEYLSAIPRDLNFRSAQRAQVEKNVRMLFPNKFHPRGEALPDWHRRDEPRRSAAVEEARRRSEGARAPGPGG